MFMEDEDLLKLENQLCFPLYACSREVVKRYKPLLDVIDLTYTQYLVMLVLWEHVQINVKRLGEYLYLDSGTLTPLLKKMEQKGLLTRQRSEKDERNVILTITKDGKALKQQAVDIPVKMGCSLPLTRREIQQLYDLLYKVLGSTAE